MNLGEDCVICGKTFDFKDGELSYEEQFVCINCSNDYLSKYDGSLDQKIEKWRNEL